MPFILDGLDSEEYDRTYKDRELLHRIAGYFRHYRRQAILASLMLTLNSAAGTAGPILISRALDLIKQDPSTRAFLFLSLGVLLLGIFAFILANNQYLLSADMAEARYDCTVVSEASVTMQFAKIFYHQVKIVRKNRSVRMACHLNGLPGCQV